MGLRQIPCPEQSAGQIGPATVELVVHLTLQESRSDGGMKQQLVKYRIMKYRIVRMHHYSYFHIYLSWIGGEVAPVHGALLKIAIQIFALLAF